MINDEKEMMIINDKKYPLKETNENNNSICPNYYKYIKFKNIFAFLLLIFFLITFDHRELNITYNEEEPQIYYKGDYFFIRPEIIDSFNNYINNCIKGISFDINTLKSSSNPKITVIMPIYNGGKYLYYSLRSIQNQKMKDIEIILIDDCSTDNTISIIEKYMKEDPRIRLIKNKQNRRILYSKSISALNAKGKYILQLDQDDMFITDQAFDILFNKSEENKLDLLQFKDITTEKVQIRKVKLIYYMKPSKKGIKTQPNIKNSYFNWYNFMLWGMLIKAEIYKKVIIHYWNIIINYKIVHIEDYQITFFFTIFAERFQSINFFFIFHIYHSESAGITFNQRSEGIFSMLFAANNMIDYHIKSFPEDIYMFMRFYPPFTYTFKDFMEIMPNFTKFILKKFYDNPFLSYKEKTNSKYYKTKILGQYKIWNTYEYIMDSKEYNSILSYQNKIKSNYKKYIKNSVSNPKYSIIIYYNMNDYLEMTINSIENQLFDNFEIILIYDNNNMTEYLSIKNIIEEYNNIKIINNNYEKGIFNSFLNGIMESKGEYILTFKSGYTISKENFLDELDKYIDNSIDIFEFNLLINNYEIVQNNSLNLYRCLHFKSDINSSSYKVNKNYKEIDQEKELIVNKIIKSEIYKNIIKQYKNILEEKKIYYYYDEIIWFLLNQNNIKFNHSDIFGIIEYKNIVKSFNLNILDKNNNQLVQDTIFYINFLFDYSKNTFEDKKYVICEFYNYLNIIYNKFNKKYLEISEDANKLIKKFFDCEYISSDEKDNLKIYYNSLVM